MKYRISKTQLKSVLKESINNLVLQQLEEDPKSKVFKFLTETLIPTLTDLIISSKHAHWNVKGINFIPLHELFEEIYKNISEHQDILAERAIYLKDYFNGTMQAAFNKSLLGPYNTNNHSQEIIERLQTVSSLLDAELQKIDDLDPITGNLLQDLGHDVDKLIWKLKASC